MALADTLQKVEQEIAEGKLGIARDRLHGLVLAYPKDFSLRTMLGDVYWALGYPREAGRWWFLDEDLDDRKREAIALFVKECGDNPAIILRRLKLRLDPFRLESDAARQRIQELIEACLQRGLALPYFKTEPPKEESARSARKQEIVVGIILFTLLALLAIGFLTVIRWIASLF